MALPWNSLVGAGNIINRIDIAKLVFSRIVFIVGFILFHKNTKKLNKHANFVSL